MPQDIIIAIDGFSACGKSTLARDLAASLQYRHIDSGAMYRATTFFFLQKKVDINDLSSVKSHLHEMDLSLRHHDGKSSLYLGENVLDQELRTKEVSQFVSQVAAIPIVRELLVQKQQALGVRKGIIMDGRDIGSVVFPNARLKIFLTATLSTRIGRRYAEITQKGLQMTREEVAQNLKHRDHIDSTRSTSPLTQVSDAVVIDNTNLTKEEQIEMILALARIRIKSS
ncbi:UNVERIFIED_CONTAM: hypothetical protein GTU68_015056 [Idotea baltica]|nr:hypothetical protein [Idotea baltica]